MSRRTLTRHHTQVDNLAVAQRLQAIAIDQMYTFDIGTRTLPIEGISEHRTVTARHMAHVWGCSVQLWARDRHGAVHAAAESSVVIDDQRGGNISSRIRQFRTGELLWTHTADPVSEHRITPELATYVATGGDVRYELAERLEIDTRDAIKPVWILTAPGTDFTPIRCAGLVSAAGYITTYLEGTHK